jgi:choline-glycine betaine transporter
MVSLLWFAIFGGGAIGIQERAERAQDTGGMLAQLVDGVPDIVTDSILFELLQALPVGGVVAMILIALSVVLVAIFFVTGADSASIVMGGLSEHGAEEPSRRSVIFWGVATGAVAAIMLLAGGSDRTAALNGLQNITIVSSLPFVIVMLVLCVAIWKDLSKDPLIIRNRLARHVLEEAVDSAIDRHDGEAFELRTVEAVVEVSAEDAEKMDADKARRDGANARASEAADSAESAPGAVAADDAAPEEGSADPRS